MTPHFTIRELTHSDTAEEHGVSNMPTNAQHVANLRSLALFLECVRRLVSTQGFGRGMARERAVRVHSAYRSPKVNKLVGGVSDSAHCLGLAADISVEGLSSLELARLIWDSPLAFDQVGNETSRGVVHVSVDPRLRRTCFTQHGPAKSQIRYGELE